MDNKNKYNNSARSKSKLEKNKNSRFAKPGFGSQQSRHGVLSLTQLLSRAGKKRSNGAYSLLALGSSRNEKSGALSIETKKLTLNYSSNPSLFPYASAPHSTPKKRGGSASNPGRSTGIKGGAPGEAALTLTLREARASDGNANATNAPAPGKAVPFSPSGGGAKRRGEGGSNFTSRNNVSGSLRAASTQSKQTFGKSYINGLSSSDYISGASEAQFSDRKNSAYLFRGVASPDPTLAQNAAGIDKHGSETAPLLRSAQGSKRLQSERVTSGVTKEGGRLNRAEQSGSASQVPLKPIIPPKSLIIILKEKPEKILYNRRIIDYKHCGLLQRYTGLGGKILPRRQTRLTARQQRYIAKTIKTARIMGLLPFVSKEKGYFK